jgi:hypothetical protein
MLRRIEDMPAGTIGFEAVGEVEDDGKDVGFRARHATSFERLAVVSDEDWVRPASAPSPSCSPGRRRGSASQTCRPRSRGWQKTD